MKQEEPDLKSIQKIHKVIKILKCYMVYRWDFTERILIN